MFTSRLKLTFVSLNKLCQIMLYLNPKQLLVIFNWFLMGHFKNDRLINV